jgi:hypothetical protein
MIPMIPLPSMAANFVSACSFSAKLAFCSVKTSA